LIIGMGKVTSCRISNGTDIYDNCDIFAGRLFPVNERATRTIRNLHVENERVIILLSK